jgi:hypothetical protein
MQTISEIEMILNRIDLPLISIDGHSYRVG